MTRTKGPRASEDERKERRRAANRRSARKSRYKENVLLDELQKTVTELAKQNQSLKAENDAFKQDVVALQGLMVCKNNMQLQSVVSSFQYETPRLRRHELATPARQIRCRQSNADTIQRLTSMTCAFTGTIKAYTITLSKLCRLNAEFNVESTTKITA